MTVVVEDCPDPRIKRLTKVLAEACEKLGHNVLRWRRACSLPRCQLIFWWGDNQTIYHYVDASRFKAKIIFMELGWTFDRDTHLQLDRQGVGGLTSWAEDLLGFMPASPPTARTGDLLVALRYDGVPIRTSRKRSPWFQTNLAWLEHLIIGSRLPLRLRPHSKTPAKQMLRLERFARDKGLVWEAEGSFGKALHGAAALAVVDSTCAIQALESGVPVLLYGKQVCRHPEVVYCMDESLEKTSSVTEAVLAGNINLDKGAIAALLDRVRAKQWDGNNPQAFPERLRWEFDL